MLLGGYLVYGVAAMFLTLSAICALGAIIYPFYIIFEGIKNKYFRFVRTFTGLKKIAKRT